MKKIFGFMLIIFISLSLSSCTGEGVTPVAYTRYETTGNQYAYYSSDAFGLTQDQIEIFKDFEDFNTDYSTPEISFKFYRCLGYDSLDEVKYTLVDVSDKKIEMTVSINKTSGFYSSNKNVYLNGTKLLTDDVFDGESLLILTFKDLTFVRTNPGGSIDSNKVNVLEYR